MTSATARVASALRSLFPRDVATAAERIVPASTSPLWPEEHAAVAGAVPLRLAEFVAGRTAARRVLEMLDHPAQALPMGPDRAAIWPKGIAGSIAHAAGYAVAAGRRGAALGVDIEEDAEIPPELWNIICDADELFQVGQVQTGRLVRQIFCAKEAVFKAQDPARRAMFGHHTMRITLAETRFDAQFLANAGAFRSGQVVHGRLAVTQGVVLAGVAV